MRVLLDTHALLWWLAGDAQLSPAAREAIGNPAHELFVSAASAWEVAYRHVETDVPPVRDRRPDTPAEVALLVSDASSGQGLGKRLMESLLALAREQGLARLDGLVLCKNSAMLKLVRALGFSVKPFDDDEDFKFVSKPLG